MSIEEIEGHASWIDIHFMEYLGAYEKADTLRQELLERADEYGNNQ